MGSGLLRGPSPPSRRALAGELPEDGLDVCGVLHGAIGAELEDRRHAKVEVIPQPVPDEAAGARQPLQGRPPLILGAEDRDVDLGLAQVLGRLHLGHGHEPEPRILQLALEEHRYLLLDELVDPVQALALHRSASPTRAHKISTEVSRTRPSTWSSMKSIALLITALACRASWETQATARVARCQRSWWSTSATATSKRPRSLSFRLLRIWRLPFSELTSGRCRSTVPRATRATDIPRLAHGGLRAPPNPPGARDVPAQPGRPSTTRCVHRPSARASEGARDFLRGEELEDVPRHDPCHADPDAALLAGRHLAHLVLEALEGGDRPLAHVVGAPAHADLGRPHDPAFLHVAAADRAQLGDVEDLPDLGAANDGLADLGGQHPGQGRSQIVDGLVDDVV